MEAKFSIPKKANLINEKTLIVAVDLGKDSNMGYCRTPNGFEVKPFRFSNNREGFNHFWSTVQAAMARYQLERAVVGFESTGSYGEPLEHFLKDKPEVVLVQVNPMHVKRFKEVTDNSPNKRDEKDPRVIAQLMQMGSFLSCIIPEGAPAQLRELIHAREFQIKLQVQASNRLQDLVHKVFPEFSSVIKNPLCETGRYLLYHYPRPEQITSLGLRELTKIMQQKSRGKLGPWHAKRLWEAARDSVGVKQALASLCLEIRLLLQQIEDIGKTIQQIEVQLPCWLGQVPYSKRLLSIKGVGAVTVAGVIGESGGLERFSGQKALMKLPGLNLYEISSGKHQGERHISKRGRPLLRKLLYFAALNTTRRGGIMYLKYQEMLARGMEKIKAQVAISRKLLRLMYALVRDNKDYIHSCSDPSTPLRTRLRKAA
ncbi:MAG: IS110 family transposase [Candidatus Omnitrophota bacterium]